MSGKLLISELENYFQYAPWPDIIDRDTKEIIDISEVKITEEEVLSYNGKITIHKHGYDLNYKNRKSRREEHIVRIRAILLQDPDLWKPISVDHDWMTFDPIVCDGHHRLFAAKILKLESINAEWSGMWEVYKEHFPISIERGLFREK